MLPTWFMIREHSLCLLLAATCCGPLAAQEPAPAGAAAATSSAFDQAVAPFLAAHCNRCHGQEEQSGELRLDTLSRDFAAGGSAAHWADVMYRISSAEMPPKEEPQPTAEQATQVVDWLNARLKEGEAARLAKRERVTFHKLTREEYANSLYDLLGVHYDATDPAALPEDPNWHGFERIGSVLSLSPAHVEKYLSAAEGALLEAFPDKRPEPFHLRWNPWDLRGMRDKDKLEKEALLDKVRLDVWAGSTFTGHPGSVQHLNIPVAGDYRARLKLSGLQPPGGRAPHVTIYAADLDRMLFEQDVIASEDQPVTLEFQMHLAAGTHVIRMTNEVPAPSNLGRAGRSGSKPFFSIKQGRFPWQRKLTDEQGLPIEPFLIVDWIEWDGPLIAAGPTLAQQRFSPPDYDAVHCREALSKFAEKAIRRPVESTEIDRFMTLMERELAAGETPPAALRTAMLSVLCSKDFFYIVEGSADANQNRINDWELASRLSYFLWSTSPDDELLNAARSAKLHEPEVLRGQVRRMLADPKIHRFSQAFASQWLQLGNVGKFPPDKRLYPDYDDYLERSMAAESVEFFHHVLTNKLSLGEFLSSDWTMLNARLAAHYGVTGVASGEFQRVALSGSEHRGGLLTQASVLSLTSDGTRHRPVHRGKWVLESILGRSVPPPPANVKPVEPTPSSEPKATLRMKLAAHLSDPNCASCHKKIDPLGFAFDNYDAIGRWRTEEKVVDGAGDNPLVDASGMLTDGRKFASADELKQLLLADMPHFSAAFADKLATFALRRAMSIDDRDDLAQIAAQSAAADYRLSDTIEALVLSELFQSR